MIVAFACGCFVGILVTLAASALLVVLYGQED